MCNPSVTPYNPSGGSRNHPKRQPIPTRSLGIRVAQGRESEPRTERNDSRQYALKRRAFNTRSERRRCSETVLTKNDEISTSFRRTP